MTNPDIQQAKEWADYHAHTELVLEGSAARVIQSLPDHIIDAKKVAELADDMANWSLLEMPSTAADDRRHLIELLGGFADRINDILTPPPPTLAELIEAGNDPQKYVGMQCMVHDFPSTRVITKVKGFHVSVLREDLEIQHTTTSDVTPLPGEPKLEWPGDGVVDAEIVDDEPALPRPEDVKPGECWLIESRRSGKRGPAERNEPDSSVPWSPNFGAIRLPDSDVTLVSRLVPEVAP